MPDFDFNNFNSNPENNHSEREKLEIDSDGKTLGQAKDNKRKESLNNINSNSRFGGGKGYNNQGGSGGSWWKVLMGLIVVGIVIYIPIASSSGSLPNKFRNLFGANAQENTNNFINEIQVFKKESDKAFNKLDSDSTTSNTSTTQDFYDTNALYDSSYISTQVDRDYLVFVYTGNKDQDEAYIKWIKNYEKTEKDGFKIYRISYELAISDYYVQEAVSDENYNLTEEPLLMIYYTKSKNKKVLDSIIKNSDQLAKVPDYLEGLVKKAKSS